MHVYGRGSPGGIVVKNPLTRRCRGPGFYPWVSPLEEEMATHSKYSCLENSMDRGDWQATVHRVAKSQTRQLPNMSMTIGMRKWCRNGADSGKVDHYIPENSAE